MNRADPSKYLLAIQLHRGNPNRVEIKDLRIKNLPKGDILPFTPNALPKGSKRIDKPRTSNPQGVGPCKSKLT